MKTPTYLYFPLEEYQERLQQLRTRMEAKGVDVMLIHTPENLYYMSGYQTPGYYWYQTLAVPLDKEPVFITRLIEDSNVQALSWVEDSRPYEDSDDWVAKTKDALVDLGMADKRIGVEKESWFLTVGDYERLCATMPSAQWVDCSGLVEQGRMIKSPQEIEYMRQAAEAAEAGMRAGIEACRVGATENEVAAEIHSVQIKTGSEYTGLPIFISAGPRSALAHATWYRQELQPGWTVFLEIPGCIHRYHAAMMRCVYLGEPTELLLKTAEVMVTALEKTITYIKPGVSAEEAYEVCRRTIDDSSIGVKLAQRAAYSIGIGFAPDWGEGYIISMKKGEKRPLQKGMTFHLIPLVFLKGIAAIGVTETILVTENGCESLTPNVERRLFAK